jgi:cytosine/adenosine deaminase-related metal-dependent hydrolase
MTIQHAIDAHRKWHGSFNDRLHVWMATDTPRGADELGFKAIGEASLASGIRLTMHLTEAPKDFEMIAKSYKATPGQFARNVKCVGPHVVLGHMVHLDNKIDLPIIKDTNTSVAHNPGSNAKLADGIAPIPEMLAKGINVCIGSDGAPCNNGHDLFRDMRLSALLQKAIKHDASLLSAEQVLEMATINGAKAMGLEKEIGSLETGKKADFVVLDPSGVHAAPYDRQQIGNGGMHPSTLVVHSCSGSDVDMVVIDGEILVRDGAFTKLDEQAIKSSARDAIVGIRERSGIVAQPMTNGWQYV